MLKVVAISDTHGMHSQLTIEPCDILIHCGDYSGMGYEWEVESFLEWFNKQPATRKIFINGNHEVEPEKNKRLFNDMLSQYPGITYLEHSMVEIEGLKIYGYPLTPRFNHWGYMADRGSIKMLSALSMIPSNIDILVSHGPPYQILDKCDNGAEVGCVDLLNELDRIAPKFFLCGHIHSSKGEKIVNGIHYINCAVLNDHYQLVFKPTVFTVNS